MSNYSDFNTEQRFSIGQSDCGDIIVKGGEPIQFDTLFIDLLIMVDALESIKNNSCCKPCREAGLVAKNTLIQVFGEV
ncbi:MAG: hypothetical protein GY774_10915 [Planctomycetes bacterium]|nr:hypothetical protein [Planctomycetota bacterium]